MSEGLRREPPPYRAATLTALAILAGYVITLAPTVTFWDAGEFITAARTLGIPHPPGTPVYVLVAHVWGLLVPFGNYAWRLNLLSAICGAAAAACWFLVAHAAALRAFGDIDAASRRVLARYAGIAAACLVAFGFTTWQNSTEAEAHTLATCFLALAAWCAIRWRDLRTAPAGTRLLLLLLYLGAISLGNHLLALLVGPAVVAALLVESNAVPLATVALVRAERSRIATIAASWLLLVAIGLGSAGLLIFAGACAVTAVWFAVRRGQAGFTMAALLIVAVGVTPYLFLLLRSQQAPWLNEAAPATWDALLGVIRRVQYPVRTPLDDPTILHGAGNPGRTPGILGYQLANYAQYFDWQWARSLGAATGPSPARLAVTLLMLTIGIHGAFVQRAHDRSGFALVLMLFLVTGIGLVWYMNFKPGPSVGWDRWTNGADHEVRERDYFFVSSFVAWGVWVAIGLAAIARRLIPRVRVQWRPAMLSVFGIALLPCMLNFRMATRRQTREATFARDFAEALLQSVPANGILFTWGDNDTFPLWYVQVVEGQRRDVTIVCLSLAETPWYMKQLRDAPAESPGMGPLHDLADSSIDAFVPVRTDRALTISLANGDVIGIPAGAAIYGRDFLVLHVLEQNAGRRPIAWSITATDALWGLGPRLIQTGLALVMPVGPVDSTRLAGGAAEGPEGAPLDLVATRQLIEGAWHFGPLATSDARLDPNVQFMAGTWALPVTRTGIGLLERGDSAGAVVMLERAVHIAHDSIAGLLLDRLAHTRTR